MTGAELWGDDPTGQGLVAAVDPADLKKVWDMGQETIAKHGPNPRIAMGHALCSPGANVMAVWHRASILGLLAEHASLFPPQLPSEVKDVVFNVAAKFPMKRGVYQGLPLNLQQFVQEIENEVRGLGYTVD